jgi:hypothetical protein
MLRMLCMLVMAMTMMDIVWEWNFQEDHRILVVDTGQFFYAHIPYL